MMFVFGEVSDAIQETTMLVEDIVRSQVIEIVRSTSTHIVTRGLNYLLNSNNCTDAPPPVVPLTKK